MRACFPYTYLDVKASPWFVVLIIFFALAVVSGKRLAEIRNSRNRVVLGTYSEPQLQIMVGSFWTLTIVSYAAWLQNQQDNLNLIWGLSSLFPFIAIQIRLLPKLINSKSETPEELLMKDQGSEILGAVWLVSYLFAKDFL